MKTIIFYSYSIRMTLQKTHYDCFTNILNYFKIIFNFIQYHLACKEIFYFDTRNLIFSQFIIAPSSDFS